MCLSVFCKWGEGFELLPVVNKCAKSFSSLYTWEWNCYIPDVQTSRRKLNCFLKVLRQVTVLSAMFKSASCFLAFLILSIISGGETVSYCSLNLHFLLVRLRSVSSLLVINTLVLLFSVKCLLISFLYLFSISFIFLITLFPCSAY